MRLKFDYVTDTGTVGHMSVEMEKFFPNTQSNVKKLFKLMIPDLTREQLEGVEAFLIRESQPEEIDRAHFLQLQTEYLRNAKIYREKYENAARGEKREWRNRWKDSERSARDIIIAADRQEKKNRELAAKFELYLQIFRGMIS